MTRELRTSERGERGFALIGVIMLIIALTWIGGSLFALSSYESQFMIASLDREQMFEATQSAIERAKFQLAKGGRLENSNWGFPAGGIDSVVATQTIGPNTYRTGVIAGGVPVSLTAYGRLGDVSVATGGQFEIRASIDYYKRLLTVAGPITALNTDKIIVRGDTAWWNTANASWLGQLHNELDGIRMAPPSVPAPPIAAYLAAHGSTTQATLQDSMTTPTYTLDAGANNLRYFSYVRSTFAGLTFLETHGTTTIRVRGRAVWVFPEGVFFQNRVRVEKIGSDPSACLVIVAGPSTCTESDPEGPWAGKGIWFDDGLDSDGPDGLPVVLVTNGAVQLTKRYDNQVRSVDYFSVYASEVRFKEAEKEDWTLRHRQTASQDQPGGVIDWLTQQGALPNAVFTGGQLTLKPGTWNTASN